MKQLVIPQLTTTPTDAQLVPALLDEACVPFQSIDNANWKADYPYTPKVQFRLAYTDEAFLIHYQVEEGSVAAVAPHDCGHVWEDSCCEFFAQVADDDLYYNLECNAAGTLLVACGPEREGREVAPQMVLQQVKRWSSLGREPFAERVGDVTWQLALVIPFATFFRHRISSMQGKTFRANFYKCGDKLQRPHFLSWNPIAIPRPDFHRKDFFGQILAQ